MTGEIGAVLRTHGSSFAAEIALAVKYHERRSERIVRLRRGHNGVLDGLAHIYVITGTGASRVAMWEIDAADVAYSMSIDAVPEALVELMDQTAWFVDSVRDECPESIRDAIDERIEEGPA